MKKDTTRARGIVQPCSLLDAIAEAEGKRTMSGGSKPQGEERDSAQWRAATLDRNKKTTGERKEGDVRDH